MKVIVHPIFVVYLIVIGLIDCMATAVSLCLTLLIHEAGHLFVGYIFGERYERIDLSPLGGMISYKSGCASCKGLKGVSVAAAGPGCNAAAAWLYLNIPVIRNNIPVKDGSVFILMNIAMALMNLMPVLPLDGGRIVFSLGYYICPLSPLMAVLTNLGRIWGAVCVMLSFAGAIRWGRINISLAAAGVYIAVCAEKQKEEIYANNLHTVLSERYHQSNRIAACQAVCVCPQLRILAMIPYLSRYEHIVCIVKSGQEMILIDEHDLLDRMLQSPADTFEKMLLESRFQE